MPLHLRMWVSSLWRARNRVALEPLRPQENSAPEGTWESMVPQCPDQVADDFLQEGGDADLQPSTSTEPRSSTPRIEVETMVRDQLVQPSAIEGSWVADGLPVWMRADLSFVTIAKGILITANQDTFSLGQGPNPQSIAFSDACLSLQSNGVMRLCAKSEEVVLFKRVDALCRTTSASLQGRWKHRGESRHHTKILTIQGMCYELSVQHFEQHRTSKGMLRWQHGAMAMMEGFKLSIMTHEEVTLRSPSGHVWRFRKAR